MVSLCKENQNLKAEAQTVLQKSVPDDAKQIGGDPPAPTDSTDHQISHDPDDGKESKHRENNQKPEDSGKLLTGPLSCRFLDGKVSNQANVYCISQPTGDQSLSYIHGLPRRNFRDWSLEQMARSSSDQPKDIGQRPNGMTKEDTFLLALIRRELKSLPLSSDLLDKLQKELKILNPVSSGFLLQSQLSHLFLRLGVPLQLPTVKILCQRFSRGSSPEMVSSAYLRLLMFLLPILIPSCNTSSPVFLMMCSAYRQVRWSGIPISQGEISHSFSLFLCKKKRKKEIDDAVKALHSICQQIWKTQQWP
ncbi:hypothetical protein FD754_024410, partial [Muntiacus muntjak]